MLLSLWQLYKRVSMQNINLNPGGLIGAVLALAAVIITVVLTSNPDTAGSRVGGFGVPALFLGAFGGNYLWERLFSKGE
jgi:hypothetical protein